MQCVVAHWTVSHDVFHLYLFVYMKSMCVCVCVLDMCIYYMLTLQHIFCFLLGHFAVFSTSVANGLVPCLDEPCAILVQPNL